jgi:hypothetical protein
MIELADIFWRYGPEYRAKFKERIPQSHLEAMEAIEHCRTAALGGHVYQGMECGEPAYSYHSCTHRHCPKCQNAGATQGLEAPRERLLPIPYVLVTFTLPEELRPGARSHQHLMYNLLFQTSAAALKALAWTPNSSADSSAWLGSCTPGRGIWPIIRMSIIACPVEPCRHRAPNGSRPAIMSSLSRSARSPHSSVASSGKP